MAEYREFFSHGGDDTYIVTDLLRPKLAETGAEVFVDAGEIQYGDDFRGQILDEIGRCDELVVLLTASSLRRPWVAAEIGAMLVRGKRIVTIIYGPSETELQDLGELSLLGTNKLLELNDFGIYVEQLRARVEASANE